MSGPRNDYSALKTKLHIHPPVPAPAGLSNERILVTDNAWWEEARFLENFNKFKESGLGADSLADWEKVNLMINAANYGNTYQISYLVQSGIPVDIKTDDGLTPLYSAANRGRLCAVNFLLSLGANPLPVDDQGESVLDCNITPEIRDALTKEANRRIEAGKGINKGTMTFDSPIKYIPVREARQQRKNLVAEIAGLN